MTPSFPTSTDLMPQLSYYSDVELDLGLDVQGQKATYTIKLRMGGHKTWGQVSTSSVNAKSLIKRLNKAIAELSGEVVGR